MFISKIIDKNLNFTTEEQWQEYLQTVTKHIKDGDLFFAIVTFKCEDEEDMPLAVEFQKSDYMTMLDVSICMEEKLKPHQGEDDLDFNQIAIGDRVWSLDAMSFDEDDIFKRITSFELLTAEALIAYKLQNFIDYANRTKHIYNVGWTRS